MYENEISRGWQLYGLAIVGGTTKIIENTMSRRKSLYVCILLVRIFGQRCNIIFIRDIERLITSAQLMKAIKLSKMYRKSQITHLLLDVIIWIHNHPSISALVCFAQRSFYSMLFRGRLSLLRHTQIHSNTDCWSEQFAMFITGVTLLVWIVRSCVVDRQSCLLEFTNGFMHSGHTKNWR